MAVETDVVNFLGGQTAGGLSLVAASNVFTGHPDDDNAAGIPDDAVFVRVEGGPPVVPYFGGASGSDWNSATVAVYVRAASNNRGGGRAVAIDVNKLLHKGSISGYTMVLAMQPSPVELEKDGEERHTWKMSYRVEWKAAL